MRFSARIEKRGWQKTRRAGRKRAEGEGRKNGGAEGANERFLRNTRFMTLRGKLCNCTRNPLERGGVNLLLRRGMGRWVDIVRTCVSGIYLSFGIVLYKLFVL